MNFTDLLFYGLSGLTLLFGFLTVLNPFNRNPVTNAMFLVLTVASLAGLFVLLQAFFLAAIQVRVYAGAVMVLFLFVIMLLDLKEEDRRRIKLLTLSTGAVAVAALAGLLVKAATRARALAPENAWLAGETKPLGRILLENYLLPFEVLSILLLVAMVGVILLSKKDLK